MEHVQTEPTVSLRLYEASTSNVPGLAVGLPVYQAPEIKRWTGEGANPQEAHNVSKRQSALRFPIKLGDAHDDRDEQRMYTVKPEGSARATLAPLCRLEADDLFQVAAPNTI